MFSHSKIEKNIFSKIKKIYERTRNDLKNSMHRKLGPQNLSALRSRTKRKKMFSRSKIEKIIFSKKKIKKIYERTRNDLKNSMHKKLGSQNLSALRSRTKRKKCLVAQKSKKIFFQKKN